jgi:hypothetical protein
VSAKLVGIIAFIAGLLLAVRVMFFGVQRKLSEDEVRFRGWPLTLAVLLSVFGAVTYVRAARGGAATPTFLAGTLGVALLAAGLAWWTARRSASAPSTDPEDDPEFRFQGQVATVIDGIESRGGATPTGRIAFEFDGKRYEFRARWTPGDWEPALGRANAEVVIERVDGDVAFVEPWVAIEERL